MMICFLPPKPPAAIVQQQSPDRQRFDRPVRRGLGDARDHRRDRTWRPERLRFALPPDPELSAIGNAALERWWRESRGYAPESTKARSVRRAGRSGKLTPTPNSL